MKRFVASMLAVAIAVCFSFQTGCTPKGDKFSVTPTTLDLTKKDEEKTAEAKNGEIKEVKSDTEELVKASFDKLKITVKQLKDAPDADKTVKVTVTPKSGDAVTITVTVKKKEAPAEDSAKKKKGEETTDDGAKKKKAAE